MKNDAESYRVQEIKPMNHKITEEPTSG